MRMRTVWAVKLLLLLALPAALQAQFNNTASNGQITITGYTGPGGAVIIPSTLFGLPVTSIGYDAFYDCTSLTGITIPDCVTSIADGAFCGCTHLTSVTIPNSVTEIGSTSDSYDWGNVQGAFESCERLTNVTIPDSVTSIRVNAFCYCTSLPSVTIGNGVTSIGDAAFSYCTSLTSVTIPGSVTNIGENAFDSCASLTGVYFQGNAPSVVFGVFGGDNSAVVYYLPGTQGWDSTFKGRPTALWNPQVRTGDPSFGVRTNQFGFTITGSTNLAVVVEACTNLANPAWSPVATSVLTGGSSYFSDPRWTNHSARFYRLRSP